MLPCLVWCWVCLTSILLQTGSFSRAETSLVSFVLFSLRCCGRPQGPASILDRGPGWPGSVCALVSTRGSQGATRTCPRPDLVFSEPRMDRSWDFAVKCSTPELSPQIVGFFNKGLSSSLESSTYSCVTLDESLKCRSLIYKMGRTVFALPVCLTGLVGNHGAGGDRECIGNAKTPQSWKLLSFPNLPEVLVQRLGRKRCSRGVRSPPSSSF